MSVKDNKKFNLNSLNRLSVDQKLILIDFYKHFNKFPKKLEILELKIQTKMDVKKIASWFAYERYLEKRDSKKKLVSKSHNNY